MGSSNPGCYNTGAQWVPGNEPNEALLSVHRLLERAEKDPEFARKLDNLFVKLNKEDKTNEHK